MDIIARKVGVPVEAKVGDWMCFGGMGAYTFGCRTSFNGMVAAEHIYRWPLQIKESLEVGEMLPVFAEA
jgi:hypothetical protein